LLGKVGRAPAAALMIDWEAGDRKTLLAFAAYVHRNRGDAPVISSTVAPRRTTLCACAARAMIEPKMSARRRTARR